MGRILLRPTARIYKDKEKRGYERLKVLIVFCGLLARGYGASGNLSGRRGQNVVLAK